MANNDERYPQGGEGAPSGYDAYIENYRRAQREGQIADQPTQAQQPAQQAAFHDNQWEGQPQPAPQPAPQLQPAQRQQPAQRPINTQQPQLAPQAQGGFVPAQANYSHQRQSRAQSGNGAANPYAQYSRAGANYGGYAAQRQGMSRGKKIAIVLVVIAIIAAVAAGGAYAFTQMRKAEVNADLHNMDEKVLEAIDAELTGQTSFTEPFTVLLLGSDERDEDDEAYDAYGSRTDTIILVRVDPTSKEVSMVSIPRDTMVNLPGVGPAKINAAYYYGGAAGTIAAVKELTGVEIDHYAFVNFGGLVDLVNAVGGIDVYVEETVDNPKAGNVVVEAGQQHLDGEHALTLARDRDYADGDYTRVQNQRKVIMGIIERVMNAPASDLAGLIQASTGFVQTDSGITFDWILSLAQQMRHVEDNHDLQVVSVTLPSTPAYIGEVSYVIADMAGTAELMQIFLSGGDVSQPLTQSSIAADVANAGGTYGGGSSSTIASDDTYYYEETVEYYEEPAAEQAPAQNNDSGNNGGEGGNSGDNNGGGEGGNS